MDALENERCYGSGMDALVTVCSWNLELMGQSLAAGEIRPTNALDMVPAPSPKTNTWVVSKTRTPFWYPLRVRRRNIIYNKKGPTFLTATHK